MKGKCWMLIFLKQTMCTLRFNIGFLKGFTIHAAIKQTTVITGDNFDLQFRITTHFQFSKLLTKHQMTIFHEFI